MYRASYTHHISDSYTATGGAPTVSIISEVVTVNRQMRSQQSSHNHAFYFSHMTKFLLVNDYLADCHYILPVAIVRKIMSNM